MPDTSSPATRPPTDTASTSVLLLEHGYWPTPSKRTRHRIPHLALWHRRAVDPRFPWADLPKPVWDALELWARAAGGIVRVFFGLDQPDTSVTFYTYAAEYALEKAYSGMARPHWDWCDDTGAFQPRLDGEGRAWVSSWFPDQPAASKTYYLAWDDSHSGYWVSCPDICAYELEEGVACTVNEALVLSDIVLEYEPFAFERFRARQSWLAQRQAELRRQDGNSERSKAP